MTCPIVLPVGPPRGEKIAMTENASLRTSTQKQASPDEMEAKEDANLNLFQPASSVSPGLYCVKLWVNILSYVTRDVFSLIIKEI